MKIEYPSKTTVEITAIVCELPIRNDDDYNEMRRTPLRKFISDGVLTLVLDVDTGKVRDWPKGKTASIHMKVVDTGSYGLLLRNATESFAGVFAYKGGDNYVPDCVPGEFGDYFIASIKCDGAIDGWKPDAAKIVECFWDGYVFSDAFWPGGW